MRSLEMGRTALALVPSNAVSLGRGWLFAFALARSTPAQVTVAVGLDSNGDPGNRRSSACSISANGLYVAFRSEASDLVPGDTNGAADVFVRDRRSGTTERVSVGAGGGEGDSAAGIFTSITPDGRFVAFDSFATNLVPGDTNGTWDVFVRDRETQTTERISIATDGTEPSLESLASSISADGRYVAFFSEALNLAPGDTNQWGDVFVRDRLSGTTECVSVSSTRQPGNFPSGHHGPSISADGRFVAFSSRATNLAPGQPNANRDVFVRDRRLGTTERVSVNSNGVQDNGESSAPSISADGRFVAFMSDATNLVLGDTNAARDVFVHDRQTGTTVRASLDSNGSQGDGASQLPSISADGRFVAFQSLATNLVPMDANGEEDVFVRDLQTGSTERASVHSNGSEGNAVSVEPALSSDGRCVAFETWSTNLVPGVPIGGVYVRDRDGDPSFASSCDPGVGGVVACPCGNPPSGAGRGCDNSAASGGATLWASGGTFLSSDSLALSSSGETPAALSLLLQGDSPSPSGVVYGQGVRCAAGAIRRLYTKPAINGCITAPDFPAGDANVSERSAALGDPISAGQSRWYFVYYRDTTVLGGCPSISTFNATQTGVVSWSP